MARIPFKKQISRNHSPIFKNKANQQGKPNYKRIVIKISGEMLGGREIFSFVTFRRLADDLKRLSRSGIKIGLVVGGGNICRGRDLHQVERILGDWIGMSATLLNGLLLKYFLEKNRLKTKILSGVEVEGIAPRFAIDEARRLYNNGYILIFVFGTGNPAFTTDTAAALRAVELGADVIIKGTKVEGIYDRDPMRNKQAKFYRRITYDSALRQRLRVMDSAAFSLCADHRIKIHVFNFHKHSISDAITNSKIGTIVSEVERGHRDTNGLVISKGGLMPQNIEDEAKKKMKKTIDFLVQELAKLRTGRASPALLEGIKVDYYGSQVPINQIAAISIPDPKMIVIQPWDKNALPEIEKAIYKSQTGLVPNNDSNVIRISIPLLTEERRRDLIKLVHKLGEDARVAIRNARRESNELAKKEEKDKSISEDESHQISTRIQKLTDDNIKSIDDILKKKEKEVMEV